MMLSINTIPDGWAVAIVAVVSAAAGASLMALRACLVHAQWTALPRKVSDDQPLQGVHREDSEVHLYGVVSQIGLCNSGSPFVNKVAALLRGFGITYKSIACSPAEAPRGKIPFLVHKNADPSDPSKDIVVTDSSLIARYLVNTFGSVSHSSPEASGRQVERIGRMLVAPRRRMDGRSAGLASPLQGASNHVTPDYPPASAWAQAASLRLVLENQLYWFQEHESWLESAGNLAVMSAAFFEPYMPRILTYIIVPIVTGGVRDACHAHGAARHGKRDAVELCAECLDVAEAVLQDGRRFITGEHLSEEDAAIFAQLEQALLLPMHLSSKAGMDRCPRVLAYCARVRSTLFPELTPSEDEAREHASSKEPEEPCIVRWSPDVTSVPPQRAVPMVQELRAMEASLEQAAGQDKYGWWRADGDLSSKPVAEASTKLQEGSTRRSARRSPSRG